MKTIWLSFDVEATGPAAGLHSMLSLGVVALLEQDRQFERIGTFSCNLKRLADTVWDPDTLRWWSHPDREEAYRLTTADPTEAAEGMKTFMDFLESLPRWPHIYAAYPATFDMPFVTYYANRFVREWWFDFYRGNPMERIACFDMASYAMELIRCGYHDVSKKRMPEPWTAYHNPLPHVALNDAEEQAHLLMRMLAPEISSLLHHPAMR